MQVVNMVKDQCMKVASENESKAFFLKMIADYYRYIAESAKGDKLEEAKNGAQDYYKQAADMDSNGWPPAGRKRALEAMRKGFAIHLAGDQHLASTIQYGVDGF